MNVVNEKQKIPTQHPTLNSISDSQNCESATEFCRNLEHEPPVRKSIKAEFALGSFHAENSAAVLFI